MRALLDQAAGCLLSHGNVMECTPYGVQSRRRQESSKEEKKGEAGKAEGSCSIGREAERLNRRMG